MPLVSNESIHTPILQNSTNVPRRTSKRRRKTRGKYNNAAATYNHHAGTGDMDVEEDIDTLYEKYPLSHIMKTRNRHTYLK